MSEVMDPQHAEVPLAVGEALSDANSGEERLENPSTKDNILPFVGTSKPGVFTVADSLKLSTQQRERVISAIGQMCITAREAFLCSMSVEKDSEAFGLMVAQIASALEIRSLTKITPPKGDALVDLLLLDHDSRGACIQISSLADGAKRRGMHDLYDARMAARQWTREMMPRKIAAIWGDLNPDEANLWIRCSNLTGDNDKMEYDDVAHLCYHHESRTLSGGSDKFVRRLLYLSGRTAESETSPAKSEPEPRSTATTQPTTPQPLQLPE